MHLPHVVSLDLLWFNLQRCLSVRARGYETAQGTTGIGHSRFMGFILHFRLIVWMIYVK